MAPRFGTIGRAWLFVPQDKLKPSAYIVRRLFGRWALRFTWEVGLIVGLGVDIAEVGRIKAAIERHGEVFLRRVYTAREREYCERFKNKFERYAGRFAAKEAAMKALGTGWARGVRWVDVEVVRQKGGRPTMALAGEAGKVAERLGVKNIALSITHTETQALAQVIFES
jgi:holo-[acyl-carrier protein] synthase